MTKVVKFLQYTAIDKEISTVDRHQVSHALIYLWQPAIVLTSLPNIVASPQLLPHIKSNSVGNTDIVYFD